MDGLRGFLEGPIAMRLASLKTGGRDGTLIVVNRDLTRAMKVPEVAKTLQSALEDWPAVAPRLAAVAEALNRHQANSFPPNAIDLAAPLPRAYQWLDGSAYLSHVERVRKARGAYMPENYLVDPLLYQGSSSAFLGPRDPIVIPDEAWGLDFEAEIAVVTDDVPMGVTAGEAGSHIKLLMLVNDISYRNLIPQELAKGFGFLQGKPGPAFSPLAVTPDEFGPAWDGGKLHLALVTHRNEELFGQPDAGVNIQFDFPALIAHAAKTRRLPAGTIIGSGTVSNADVTRGYSCIVEKRVMEQVETGQAKTPYLRPGDRVRIAMFDNEGRSLFGTIDQEVSPWRR
jgi:fumarylacetoacetate (FAA) hydrolase